MKRTLGLAFAAVLGVALMVAGIILDWDALMIAGSIPASLCAALLIFPPPHRMP